MPETQFWLPSEDKDLIGVNSSRDPLGFLPIWSQRGRNIVPNLTEQTVCATGFQLLVATLRLWEDFRVKHPDAKIQVEEFFLLVEQAFAFSTQSRTKKWPLPGSSRVVRFTLDNTPCLSLRNGLLENQLANGVWGLYRGAAARSDILSDSMRSLSAAFYQEMGSHAILQRSMKNELFGQILEAHEDRQNGVSFLLHKNRGLPDRLSAFLAELPHKLCLRRYLLPENGLAERTAAFLYEHREGFQNDPGFRRSFMELCIARFPGDKAVFERLLMCENFIAPVEKVFRYLLGLAGEPITKIGAEMDLEIDRFRSAFGEFRNSGPYTGGAAGRFATYCNGIRLSSKEDFIRSLLTCHQKVSKERRREPWVSIEEEKLLVSSHVEDSSREELDATPGKTWMNDYYLWPLLRVYEALRS
ncbi:MAG: hypothetical protein ACP5IL_15240 [Syntrophobacteraceae bacterium]